MTQIVRIQKTQTVLDEVKDGLAQMSAAVERCYEIPPQNPITVLLLWKSSLES